MAWPAPCCGHEVHVHRNTLAGWICQDGCVCSSNPIPSKGLFRGGPETTGGVGYGVDVGEKTVDEKKVRRRRLLFIGVFLLVASAAGLWAQELGWMPDGPRCGKAADYYLDQAEQAPAGPLRDEHARRAELYLEAERNGHTCESWTKPEDP